MRCGQKKILNVKAGGCQSRREHEGDRKKNWMEGVRQAMNERNLQEGQWEDRRQWSLGVGQRGGTL
jgi:hypothetical protein